MAGSLAGRLALVTGGGSGIGRAVCSVLAREGALVAVADVNLSNAEQTVAALPPPNATVLAGVNPHVPKDCQHKGFGVNVASSTEVTKLLDDVEENFKIVPSITVHAAGITRDSFLLKMDEKDFDDVLDVNLKGTFLVNQAVGRAMSKVKVAEGSIVNISSIVGKNGNIGQANYTASKAGVVGLTKTVAKEFARYNVRVNAILPGFIDTPMTKTVPEKVMQMLMFVIPMQRTGRPEEIAEVCAFLASSKSSYITGEAIEVTGGLNM